MIHTRLLDDVRFNTIFGAGYATQEFRLRSGVVVRDAQRSNAVRRYILDYSNLTPAQHATIVAAFHVCNGAHTAFLLKDWTDYTATAESIGNTPGANLTPVQLYKTYAFGAGTKQRTITKPTSGSVTVYSNGVAKAGTYSTTTGLFTPTTNWTAGHALTWTGEFDVPVRFASDELSFTYNNYQALTANIEIEEAIEEVIDPS